jgi:RNA polymerase sigma-70 factor, ECF subfamily
VCSLQGGALTVVVAVGEAPTADLLESCLERHRVELTVYCSRTLGSASEAEDAVQETLLRAWRGFDHFAGRASLRTWLYRIATNVCLDMLRSTQRRARLIDLVRAQALESAERRTGTKATRVQPVRDHSLASDGDPAELAATREAIHFALVVALQHLPARQRAVLLLRDVLRWKAVEVAELLNTTVVAVNSALQRARATLEASGVCHTSAPADIAHAKRELLARYVQAFEAYDIDGLTALIREDATQSMSS